MRLLYIFLFIVLLLHSGPILAHSGDMPSPTQEILAGWANLFAFGLIISSTRFKSLEQFTSSKWLSMNWLFTIGWLLLGVGGILAILTWSHIFYISALTVLTDLPLNVASGASFTLLWGIRTVLWMTLGGIWFFRPVPHSQRWVVTLSIAVMLISGLYLHDARSNDLVIYLLIDSVRQMATGALLVTMLYLSAVIRHLSIQSVLGYIRVSVILLLISTLAFTWQHVGNLSLIPYIIHGQVFLIQGLSLIPLLAWNLGGNKIFKSSSKFLVEGALIAGTLLFFGLSTVVNPAEGKMTWKDYLLTVNPIYDVYQDNEILTQISMTPGLVGKNELYIVLLNAQDGTHISDAQVSIEGVANNTLTSFDLQPTGDGVYKDLNADFATDGDWQINVRIDRVESIPQTVSFSLNLPAIPDPTTTELKRGGLLQVTGIIFSSVLSIFCLAITGALFKSPNMGKKIQVTRAQVGVFIVGIILLSTAILLLSSLV